MPPLLSVLITGPAGVFAIIAVVAGARCGAAISGLWSFSGSTERKLRMPGRIPLAVVALVFAVAAWVLAVAVAVIAAVVTQGIGTGTMVAQAVIGTVGGALLTHFGLRPLVNQMGVGQSMDPAGGSLVGRVGIVMSDDVGPDGGKARVMRSGQPLEIGIWCHEHQPAHRGQEVLILDHDDDDDRYRVQVLKEDSGASREIDSGGYPTMLTD